MKLGIALIATMAALVLSLLIASAKSTYDTRRNQLLQISADILLPEQDDERRHWQEHGYVLVACSPTSAPT